MLCVGRENAFSHVVNSHESTCTRQQGTRLGWARVGRLLQLGPGYEFLYAQEGDTVGHRKAKMQLLFSVPPALIS